MQFRKTLITVQNQSAYRKIFIRFGQFKLNVSFYLLYFKTCGQHIFIFNLFTDVGSVVVLVLNIPEYFFHQIFQ